MGMQGYTRVYRVYKGIQGYTGGIQEIQGYTRVYMGIQGVYRGYTGGLQGVSEGIQRFIGCSQDIISSLT